MLVNQALVESFTDVLLSGEGTAVCHRFRPGASGPFGSDLPAEWSKASAMRERLQQYQIERTAQLKKDLHGDWFDLHASLRESNLSAFTRWLTKIQKRIARAR
jgi:hypothetical protein